MKRIESSQHEADCSNIAITLRESWIIISARITPLFCSLCSKQIDGLYEYQGSRYGAIGHVKCTSCSDDIYCWDKDLGMDVLYCVNESDPDKLDTEIDLARLYALTPHVFNELEQVIGQIFKRRKRGWHPLKRLVKPTLETVTEHYVESDWSLQELIDLVYSRKCLSRDHVPQQELTPDARFPRLPRRIQEWLCLLKYLGVGFET